MIWKHYNYKLETAYNLDKLKNIENFASKDDIKHILEGEISRIGKAVGFHLESMQTARDSIIESTRSTPDKNGVYSAKLEIDGVLKATKSSFFPVNMTPQQIVNAINEVYANKVMLNEFKYTGHRDSGLEIQLYLNKDSKITTAYPMKEGR